MGNKDSSQSLKCSFCGKSQKQVIKLIAGPGVYICDECIELCVEIIEEEKVEKLKVSPRTRNGSPGLQEAMVASGGLGQVSGELLGGSGGGGGRGSKNDQQIKNVTNGGN